MFSETEGWQNTDGELETKLEKCCRNYFLKLYLKRRPASRNMSLLLTNYYYYYYLVRLYKYQPARPWLWLLSGIRVCNISI